MSTDANTPRPEDDNSDQQEPIDLWKTLMGDETPTIDLSGLEASMQDTEGDVENVMSSIEIRLNESQRGDLTAEVAACRQREQLNKANGTDYRYETYSIAIINTLLSRGFVEKSKIVKTLKGLDNFDGSILRHAWNSIVSINKIPKS
jgi:hypothetical protein